MSQVKIEARHLPSLSDEVRISRSDMRAKLVALPLPWCKIKLSDNNYFAPAKWDDWRKIIEYLKPKVPPYLVDKWDCENNAGWWQSEVGRLFGINTMADVEGWADVGRGFERHGWSFFWDAESGLFFQMEGQTGVIMDFDSELYIPDEIIMR